MASVFVSYAREDRNFVSRLVDALSNFDLGAWVDWQDIPPTADWMREIEAAIDSADAFLFIISPDSIASETCEREWSRAAANNKRLIPILRREADDIPQTLAKINWILMREGDSFDAGIEAIVDISGKDLDWIREHSRILQRAANWDAHERNESFLLRGVDLSNAEYWLARGEEKELSPSDRYREYVAFSRQVQDQVNAQRERQREELATSQSLFLADLSRQQANSGDVRLSILLALEALPQDLSTPERPLLTEAQTSLYAALQLPREQVSMLGHSGPVAHASFHPDGRRIVSGSIDGTARIWDTETGHALGVLVSQRIPVLNARWDSAGARVLTCDVNTACLWDVESGDQLATRSAGDAYEDRILGGRFVAGDSVIVLNCAERVRLLDAGLEDGPERELRIPPESRIIAVTASADLALLRHPDGTVAIWNLEDGREIRQLVLGRVRADYAALAADGKRVSTYDATDGGSRSLWDGETGERITRLTGHGGAVDAFFSPKGDVLVTTGITGTRRHHRAARLWEASKGELIAVLEGHEGLTSTVAFSPDGRRLVTGSQDGEIGLWKTFDGRRLASFRGHGEEVRAAEFSPDGTRLLSVSNDHSAKLWAVGNPFIASRFGGEDHRIDYAICGCEGRMLLSADKQGVIRLSKLDGPSSAIHLKGHRDGLLLAQFSVDGGLVATASKDGTARVWDTSTGESVAVLKGHEGWVRVSAFGHAGDCVVTGGGDGIARAWSIPDGEPLATLPGHSDDITSIAFSSDGLVLATGSCDGTVRVWDTATWKLRHVLTGPKGWAFDVRFQPGGNLLAAGFHEDAVAWDIDSGKRVSTFAGHEGAVSFIAFSPDGESLLTASLFGPPRVWHVESHGLVSVLEGSDNVVDGVFSEDGTCLVTIAKGTGIDTWGAGIWDMRNNRQVADIPAPAGTTLATLSSCGRRIANVGRNGCAEIYNLIPRSRKPEMPTARALADAARRIDLPPLSDAERLRFFLVGHARDEP